MPFAVDDRGARPSYGRRGTREGGDRNRPADAHLRGGHRVRRRNPSPTVKVAHRRGGFHLRTVVADPRNPVGDVCNAHVEVFRAGKEGLAPAVNRRVNRLSSLLELGAVRRALPPGTHDLQSTVRQDAREEDAGREGVPPSMSFRVGAV